MRIHNTGIECLGMQIKARDSSETSHPYHNAAQCAKHTNPVLSAGWRIRIRIIFGPSWIRIRIRVKSWIRTHIKVKIQKLKMLKMELSRTVDTHNGGVEAHNGALESL